MQQNIERIILSNLCYNEDFLRKVIPFLKSEYFSNGSERVIFNKILEYTTTYNTPPSKQAIIISVTDDKSVSETQYNEVQDIVNDIENEDSNSEWLLAETEKFCKDKALYNAIMEGIQIIDGRNKDMGKDALPSILSDALAVGFDNNVGHDYIDNAPERYDFYHRLEEKLPFDLEMFNKITDGGLANKTLNVALAGTGVGKSLFMCHMSAGHIAQGRNVLYITMEMAEERIAERIDANLMNVPIQQLKDLSKEMFDDRINKINNKIQGRLIIKEYPTASAHAGHFKALLNELKLKRNFMPDIIFIDYLNICASSRFKAGSAANSYTIIKSIAEELRGLAGEFNVPVVTATQTTRSGYCLDLETKVVTQSGTKNISDIAVGDEVLSNNGWNAVKTIFPIVKKKMYRITTESGKEIVCSADHLFPTEEGEKNIKSGLCLKDKLFINKSEV